MHARAPAEEELPAIAPASSETIGATLAPLSADSVAEAIDLPNLSIASMTAHECVSSDANIPGGTMDVLVRNDGKGRTGGFRLYIGTTTTRATTGATSQGESHFWLPGLAPQEERVFTVPLSYPVHSALIVGGVPEPVPGPYDVVATLDHPAGLEFLGPDGVLLESNEADNSGHAAVPGVVSGLC